MSENFAGGNIANRGNTERQVLVKILNVTSGGGGGGSGVSQIVGGSGVSVSPSYGTGVVTVSSTGGGSGGSDYSGIGSPVGVITPSQATATYYDRTTPSQPGVWYWANSTWTQYLG